VKENDRLASEIGGGKSFGLVDLLLSSKRTEGRNARPTCSGGGKKETVLLGDIDVAHIYKGEGERRKREH